MRGMKNRQEWVCSEFAFNLSCVSSRSMVQGTVWYRKFKGSDDYLRIKFEEYISAALASVKYGDFLAKGEGSGVLITPGSGGDVNSLQDFNPLWIAEFKRTNAFEVWQRITDPMLFDIIEPRHPCNEKPSAIADISLRLSEGIQELKLDQQLAPTREAISRTFTAGSTNFFKAVDGVRGRWMQRSASSTSVESSTSTTSPVEISKAEAVAATPSAIPASPPPPPQQAVEAPSSRPVSVTAAEAKERISTWGAGIGSFFSNRAARLSAAVPKPSPPPADLGTSTNPSVGAVASTDESTVNIAVSSKVESPVTVAKGSDESVIEKAPKIPGAVHEGVATSQELVVEVREQAHETVADATTPRSTAFSPDAKDEEDDGHYEPFGVAL